MRRDAGVVDEDVDAPEVAVDVLDERVELVPVPDVARARGGLGALGAQRRGHLVAGVGLAADDDDRRRRPGRTPCAMASPSPRVPPVTTATRPERSKRSRCVCAARRGDGVSWLVQDGHLLGVVVGSWRRAAKDATP